MRSTCYLLLLCLLAPKLFAHGLLLTVTSDGARIIGTAYFTNGEKAAAQDVELIDLDSPTATPAVTVSDASGEFEFPAIAAHRYRVSVFGEEGHEVQMELVAGEKSSAQLIETNNNPENTPIELPAWAVVGGILLLSLIPAFLSRKKPAQGEK